MDENKAYFDKTWQEAYDALLAGRAVLTLDGSQESFALWVITNATYNSDYINEPYWLTYSDALGNTSNFYNLFATSADGYLYVEIGD